MQEKKIDCEILSAISAVHTGHSFYEVHGFEFPAKTIFANNLKTIDWRAVYYVYLSLAQLFWPKKCTKCICTINNF